MMDHVEVKALLQEICNLLKYLQISSNDICFISNTLFDFFIWLRSANAELTQANIDVYLNSIFTLILQFYDTTSSLGVKTIA